jgi:flagellin-like hook-associated protein FlgL
MRVTQYSAIEPYKNNLQEISQRQVNNQMRIATGKDIQSIGDAPDRIPDIKKLSSLISSNENFLTIIENQISEFQYSDNQLQSISDIIQKTRQTAIDATQVGNTGNIPVLATVIKGYMEDMINNANADYNGSFLYAGTKTNADSFDSSIPNSNNLPFELIQDTPTASNPSGLKVVFKGNFEDKVINKDQNSNEVINTKADEIFGTGGTEFFDTMINLYNLLEYRDDGTPRTSSDVFSREETGKLSNLQKQISDFSAQIDKTIAQNGARSNRFDALRLQITDENTYLKDLLSLKQDTDVASVSLELAKDQNALQYALKVGGNIIPTSLLNFLS